MGNPWPVKIIQYVLSLIFSIVFGSIVFAPIYPPPGEKYKIQIFITDFYIIAILNSLLIGCLYLRDGERISKSDIGVGFVALWIWFLFVIRKISVLSKITHARRNVFLAIICPLSFGVPFLFFYSLIESGYLSIEDIVLAPIYMSIVYIFNRNMQSNQRESR